MEQNFYNGRKKMVFDLNSLPDKMSLNNDGRIDIFVCVRLRKCISYPSFTWELLGCAPVKRGSRSRKRKSEDPGNDVPNLEKN